MTPPFEKWTGRVRMRFLGRILFWGHGCPQSLPRAASDLLAARRIWRKPVQVYYGMRADGAKGFVWQITRSGDRKV
jgi:hypothetical protein